MGWAGLRPPIEPKPESTKGWRQSSGKGDEGQGAGMVQGRFRVDGARVCFEPPRGDLVTVCGRWAGRVAGEGDEAGTL